MSSQLKPAKTRTELKGLFENGRFPDQSDYADLIDAMVHRDDLVRPPAPAASVPAAAPLPAAPIDGWHRTPARMGSYDPARGPAQVQRAVNLARNAVPADGQWHPIVAEMDDCYGFELVASASGKVDSSNHALTHAIVLISLGAKGGAIQQTATCSGWDLRRKIRLKWVKRKHSCDLCIGTGVNLGRDDQGSPVQIQYHLTRVW